MTALDVIAALVFVAVVAGVSVLGLFAHLCVLLVTDPREWVGLAKAVLGV